MTGQGQGQVGIRATPPVLMDHAVCFVLGGVIKQAGDAVNGLSYGLSSRLAIELFCRTDS